MANGHGGRRPGAGQKKRVTEDQQLHNRETVMGVVTQDDLVAMTQTAITMAKSGDPASRNWISSYVLGNPETVSRIKGDDDHPLKVLIEMVNDRA